MYPLKKNPKLQSLVILEAILRPTFLSSLKTLVDNFHNRNSHKNIGCELLISFVWQRVISAITGIPPLSTKTLYKPARKLLTKIIDHS